MWGIIKTALIIIFIGFLFMLTMLISQDIWGYYHGMISETGVFVRYIRTGTFDRTKGDKYGQSNFNR